jgi:hypothetical protein
MQAVKSHEKWAKKKLMKSACNDFLSEVKVSKVIPLGLRLMRMPQATVCGFFFWR